MKPEEKWNGTVIEVLDREHGKKVIEWWKEQGVDTVYEGDDVGDCYGIYNGKFNHYSKKYALAKGKKIITIPEPFPEKWYMKITNENRDVANEWRRSVSCKMWIDNVLDDSGYYLLSQHKQDNSYYYSRLPDVDIKIRYNDYTEISTDQFLEHVYKPFKSKQEIKQENKMRTIRWQEAQDLIDMVSDNCEWKVKLSNMWASKIVLKQQIEVNEELLREGRKEASTSQIKVLDRIFGKEEEIIIKWTRFKW